MAKLMKGIRSTADCHFDAQREICYKLEGISFQSQFSVLQSISLSRGDHPQEDANYLLSANESLPEDKDDLQ